MHRVQFQQVNFDDVAALVCGDTMPFVERHVVFQPIRESLRQIVHVIKEVPKHCQVSGASGQVDQLHHVADNIVYCIAWMVLRDG